MGDTPGICFLALFRLRRCPSVEMKEQMPRVAGHLHLAMREDPKVPRRRELEILADISERLDPAMPEAVP